MNTKKTFFILLSLLLLFVISCRKNGSDHYVKNHCQTYLIGIDDHDHQAIHGSWNGGTSRTGKYTIVQSVDALDRSFPGAAGTMNVYVYYSKTRDHILMSRPMFDHQIPYSDGDSWHGLITEDGRFVFFLSDATNLIIDNKFNYADTNGITDVYVVDRDSDNNGYFDEPGGTTIERVSLDNYGFELIDAISGPRAGVGVTNFAISANGEHVAFNSACPPEEEPFGFCNGMLPSHIKLDQKHGALYVRDLIAQTTSFIGVVNPVWKTVSHTEPYSLALSHDGRYLTYSIKTDQLDFRDHGLYYQVYVVDRDPDENYVYDEIFGGDFHALISQVNYWDVSNPHNPIPYSDTANEDCIHPTISGDGRFVAFSTVANNLVFNTDDFTTDTNDDWDIITFDRDYDYNGYYDEYDYVTGYQHGYVETDIVSVDEYGYSSDGGSYLPQFSANGEYIVFQSDASTIGESYRNRPGFQGISKNFWVERDSDMDGLYDEFKYDSEVFTAWIENVDDNLDYNRYRPQGYEAMPIMSIASDGQVVGFTSQWTHLLLPQSYKWHDIRDKNHNVEDAFLRTFDKWR